MAIVLPELVAAGIYNSAIAAKGKTITKTRKTTMFEIELPTEDGGISYISDEASPIRTDIMICSKPGQLRHSRVPFKCWYVHFMLAEGILREMLMQLPFFIPVRQRERYAALFQRMSGYFESGLAEDQLMVQSLLLELIYTLYQEGQRQLHPVAVRQNNDAIVSRVIRYVQENLTADLSLTAMADLAKLSPIHFHNCFKASTGRTLRQYVEEQRIKKASNLLVTTDWTLTEISSVCGFSSQSYFSSAFKRRMGVTPREYAREVAKRYVTSPHPE